MKTPTIKVGITRSKKSICSYATKDEAVIDLLMSGFTPEDHFDAWTVFDRLAAREFRRSNGWTERFRDYMDQSVRHKRRLSDDFVRAEKGRLNLTTAFDIARFAAQLTECIFVD